MRSHEGDVLAANDLLVRIRRHWAMRERLQPVGDRVRTGQDRDHARRRAGLRRVDAADPRMRVGRAHETRVRLAGEVDVVAIAAGANEEARVVLAEDRLADAIAGRSRQRP
jgi:hypothetical protein